METNELELLKVDKTVFSIAQSFDDLEDKSYWQSRTPQERIQHIEILRQINYGDRATAGLQRILEIAQFT